MQSSGQSVLIRPFGRVVPGSFGHNKPFSGNVVEPKDRTQW